MKCIIHFRIWMSISHLAGTLFSREFWIWEQTDWLVHKPSCSTIASNLANGPAVNGRWASGPHCTRVKTRQDRINYRPITTLITVDKLFESLLSRQITEYYDSCFYYRMTAYRKKHSRDTTLLTLVEDWKLAIDNNKRLYWYYLPIWEKPLTLSVLVWQFRNLKPTALATKR